MKSDGDAQRPRRRRRASEDQQDESSLPTDETDEKLIVAGCQVGDRLAQRLLYERHSDRVYRLMYRMVGPNHADDMTQQVFLHVLRNIGKYAGKSSFSTWLYRVAMNEALQFIRRDQRRQTSPDRFDPVDNRPSAQTRIEHRDLLEHALAQLDADLRSIFLLREVEQLSYYEIALALDIAEGTVASRLSRARRQLRDFLSDTSV